MRVIRLAIGILGGLVVVLILGLWMLVWGTFEDHPEFHENLRDYEGVPASASGITVYRNWNITGVFIADFKIGEDEFVRWASATGLELREIDEPANIWDAHATAQGGLNSRHTIVRGLYGSDRRRNGGGIDLAYDRDTGKGYMARSHH